MNPIYVYCFCVFCIVLYAFTGSCKRFASPQNRSFHYSDVIMGAMVSPMTSLTIVYSTVYSGADHWPLCILLPTNSRTNGQWRGKYFHLMTSSCFDTSHCAIVILEAYLIIPSTQYSGMPLYCDLGFQMCSIDDLSNYHVPSETKNQYPYPGPVVFQWQSSGNPVCLELWPQCTLECHLRKNC